MRVAPIASVRSVTVPSVSNQESPMDTQDLLQHVPERARFSDTKMTKLDCFRSDRLLVGLNCFEPGQEQPVHAHDGADKFYFVVAGKARFVIADRSVEARAETCFSHRQACRTESSGRSSAPSCSWRSLRRQAARSPGGLHPQTVVEPIEVFGHPDDEGDLDDLSLVPRRPEPPVQLVRDLIAGADQHVAILERRAPPRLEPLGRRTPPAVLDRA